MKIENGEWKIFNFLFSAIIAILIYTNIMDNVIENKSFQFAIRIVRLYKFLCEEKKDMDKMDSLDTFIGFVYE